MKAVFIDDYGSADNLRYGEAPKPDLKPNEVLVKVDYAGLRWGDVMQRNGFPSRARPTPFIGGQEATGVIERVGSEVRNWQEGMRVMATPTGGAFAEYVAVHPSRLQRVPDSVPLEQMLAYPVNMRTAYYMVYPWAKVQEGDRVLLHAAAGGVGLLALQILKRKFKDVPVVAIASTQEKLDLLKAEGADHVINRKTQNYVDEVLKIWGPKAQGFQAGGLQQGGVDVSFNGVSGDTLGTDWQVIRKRGRWVIYGFSAGRGLLDTSKFGYDGITVMPFSSIAWFGTPEYEDATAFIGEWLETQELIQPQIHPLADMQATQRAFERGETIGKVVFRV
ncbi:MAG: zinc-binding alcohol dehydrogenase family protein [Myxococcales bacterium]|nr:zinc-binding alcohol dehydrogenase family protein [Myxococcales bacterium]MDD9967164.1 zinc-binding alcohol dehydrogenase family protein [Myxococcales bacterium]